jgi:citrate lyase subunit beta/citryl-CoA lyase
MSANLRPRRSVLYMPGSNERALDKAKSIPADALILDLEDAVAPDAKALARQQIIATLAEGGYGHRELLVRVNALSTPWGADDLQALAAARVPPHAILIPKVSTAADVLAAIATFDDAGGAASVEFWLMIETPLCILNIREVTGAHPRLKGIVMGTSDLSKDTRVRHTPERLGFMAALNLSVYAARAHGLEVIDGVHLELDDDAGLQAACAQGRELGFDGKSLIHPKQIEAANAAFAPAAAELAQARAIIECWHQAEAAGKGVVVLNGRLVENLHVEEAKRLLELGEAIAGIG